MSGSVVITGGGGFVGSYAARHFAGQGWAVTALDNLSRATLLGLKESPIPLAYNWNRLKADGRITCVQGDIRRMEDLKTVLRSADAILHTAAQVAVTSSLKDPRTDFDVNLQGSFNVLEAARQAEGDPKILFCSTNKVYGDNVNRIPVREEGTRYVFADPAYARGIPTDFPIDGCAHTPYGTSKLAADLYVQDYARTYGMKTAVFRMSCIYGEGQSGNEDQGWVAHFVISTVRGTPLTIYGDGKQVRDVLYVEDLVRGFQEALESPRAMKGGVFNIGGGPENTLSLLELLGLLKDFTGQTSQSALADWRPGDQKVYISDVSKADAEFGWRPRVSPKEGVGRLAGWYKSEFGG